MSDLLKGLDAMAKDGWKFPKEAAAKIRELQAEFVRLKGALTSMVVAKDELDALLKKARDE